jgi:2-phospho-L-lactate guanylyltransferase
MGGSAHVDDRSSRGWAVVVPVKRAERAKTRLGDLPGVDRPTLARALACDTVAAAVACPLVTTVVVVTDDAVVAGAVTSLGATVVADEPAAGLNAALRHGIARARAERPGVPVAALSADLPALRPDELGRALRAAAGHLHAFVADAAGTGTTLYAVMPGEDPEPRFGARSRAAHRAAGAREISEPGLAGLRRDVDTPVDLWDALRLGAGPATRAAAAALAGPGVEPGAGGGGATGAASVRA